MIDVKMEEFMIEQRLRQFRRVEMDEKTPVKAKHFVVGSKKGRPKNRWKVVKRDMLVTCLRSTDKRKLAVENTMHPQNRFCYHFQA